MATTTCPHCQRTVDVPLNVLTAVIVCPWCRHEFPTTGQPQSIVVAPPAPFDVMAMPTPPGTLAPTPASAGTISPAPRQPQQVVLESQTTKAISPLAIVAVATGGLFLGCFALVAAIPLAILGLLRLLVGGKVLATWHWKVEVHSNQPGTSFPNPAGPGEVIEGKKPKTLPPLK